MSALASFVLIPKTALDGLREAASPKKSWLGKPKDTYWDYLKQHGREAAQYEWSGYVLATLLPFLQERQIDLMHSDFDELGTYLTQKRGATHFIFTDARKRAHLTKLAPDSFSEEQLRDFYNEFNGSSESEAGKPMLDGVQAVRQSLQALDGSSVIVFSIG